LRLIRYVLPAVLLLGLSVPALAFADDAAGSTTTTTTTTTSPTATSPTTTSPSPTPIGNGGTGIGAPPSAPSTPAEPTVPGAKAKIINGTAYAPAYAPIQVKEAIWAGNQIRKKPYVYGGGHGVWKDFGYDCSGSVSYVLHSAGLLKTSMDSSDFETWGRQGAGQWITVYTNPGHAFVQIAGIRFDTSAEQDPHPAPGTGPRWRPDVHSSSGFQARHPANL
jgi:cell wall-associated NlpC family hydrolase